MTAADTGVVERTVNTDNHAGGAAYEAPDYFDSNPDDYVANGEMPEAERDYRSWNRRPEFSQFVAGIRYRSGAENDLYDWCHDEECEPLFIDNPDAKTDQVDTQGNSLTKMEEVESQAALHGFEVEWGDYDEDSDQVKLWLHDPKVLDLMPKDYNPYTERRPFSEEELKRAKRFLKDNEHEIRELKKRPTVEDAARRLRSNPDEAEEFDRTYLKEEKDRSEREWRTKMDAAAKHFKSVEDEEERARRAYDGDAE